MQTKSWIIVGKNIFQHSSLNNLCCCFYYQWCCYYCHRRLSILLHFESSLKCIVQVQSAAYKRVKCMQRGINLIKADESGAADLFAMQMINKRAWNFVNRNFHWKVLLGFDSIKVNLRYLCSKYDEGVSMKPFHAKWLRQVAVALANVQQPKLPSFPAAIFQQTRKDLCLSQTMLFA